MVVFEVEFVLLVGRIFITSHSPSLLFGHQSGPSDSHELGQSGSTKDGVIGSIKVSDLELDVLGAIVLLCTEGERQHDLSKWDYCIARDDAVELRIGFGEHVADVEAHLIQGLGE